MLTMIVLVICFSNNQAIRWLFFFLLVLQWRINYIGRHCRRGGCWTNVPFRFRKWVRRRRGEHNAQLLLVYIYHELSQCILSNVLVFFISECILNQKLLVFYPLIVVCLFIYLFVLICLFCLFFSVYFLISCCKLNLMIEIRNWKLNSVVKNVKQQRIF